MAGMPERTLLADDNINASIELLQSIIDALNEAKGYSASFASTCKSRNLNYLKVRRYLISLPNCKLTDAAPLSEFIPDELDGYEQLYQAIFGERNFVKAILPYDYRESAEYVLSNTSMTQREVAVIRLRFGLNEDNLCYTLEEIGKMYDVTRDRIRQIEAKAMRKLRAPERHIILKEGLAVHMAKDEVKKQAHEAALAQIKSEFEQHKAEYYTKYQHISQCSIEFIVDTLKNTDVGELDLSVRPYNCLKRAGIYNVFDVLQLTTENMMKVRNLGRHSMYEIYDAIQVFLTTKFETSIKDYHAAVHPDNPDDYILQR